MREPPGLEVIRTPLPQRFNTWRRRYVPLIIWLGAVGAAIILVQRQTTITPAVGVLEPNEVTVAPLMDGGLLAVTPDLLEHVEKGQIVALMDDAVVTAELTTAEAELTHLHAVFEGEKARWAFETQMREEDERNELRRFMVDEEEARLDLLDRRIDQEVDRVTLNRLEIVAGRNERLVKGNIIDEAAYDEARLQAEEIRAKLHENEAAITEAETRLKQAALRRADQETGQEPLSDAEPFLRQFQEQVRVQERLIEEIKRRRSLLTLAAPITGQVSAVFCHPGQTVLAGVPILSITDASSQRVLAYVDERNVAAVPLCTKALISARAYPNHVVEGRIVRTGSRIEDLPVHLWWNPQTPKRGMPLLIGGIPAGTFLPGQALNVQLIPGN